MERLAKLGFNQSYTYFAWRQSASELREYFTDLSTRTVDYFRPNAWPNTPDILTEQLQHGGRAAVRQPGDPGGDAERQLGDLRAGLRVARAPLGASRVSEEYLDSEKYQLRTWHLDDPDSIAPLITRLNEIRRRHPALQHLRTLRFHDADSPGILCYSKTDPFGDGDPILCVVNVDGRQAPCRQRPRRPAHVRLGARRRRRVRGPRPARWRRLPLAWVAQLRRPHPGRGPAHVFAVRRIEDT